MNRSPVLGCYTAVPICNFNWRRQLNSDCVTRRSYPQLVRIKVTDRTVSLSRTVMGSLAGILSFGRGWRLSLVRRKETEQFAQFIAHADFLEIQWRKRCSHI
jgi:hypothetical protein